MALRIGFTAVDGTTHLYEGNRLVVTVHGNPAAPAEPKALAHRLRAAADLEAALREAEDILDDLLPGEGQEPDEELQGIVDRARAALAKAETR